MKKILEIISDKIMDAFETAGYKRDYGRVTISNRPDLCEFQCNGSMAAAKEYKCAPIKIAGDVLVALGEDIAFSKAEAVNPGFINLNVSDSLIS